MERNKSGKNGPVKRANGMRMNKKLINLKCKWLLKLSIIDDNRLIY